MTAGARYRLTALLATLLVALAAYFIVAGLLGGGDTPKPPLVAAPSIQAGPPAGVPATPAPSRPARAPLPLDQAALPAARAPTPATFAPAPVEPTQQPVTATKAAKDETNPVATPAATPVETPLATAAADKETKKSPPPATASAAKPEPQPARGARKLPERIALRYSVQSGEEGLTIGQTIYSGQIRDGRYALVSVTEATGLSALFLNGKIVQRSEGRVTPDGLRPEIFTSAKGEKKVKTARFDWAHGQLLLPFGGVELPPEAQDLTSFPFHLAMRVEADDPAWSLSVTNGKNLRDYRFQVIGRETLTLAGNRVEALHLQGSRAGDSRLDVWLAPARDWLPVRIRTLDENGKLITMTLIGADAQLGARGER